MNILSLHCRLHANGIAGSVIAACPETAVPGYDRNLNYSINFGQKTYIDRKERIETEPRTIPAAKNAAVSPGRNSASA
jgi:hypothetical protein